MLAGALISLLAWLGTGEAQLSGVVDTLTGTLTGTTSVLDGTGILTGGTNDVLGASDLTGGIPSLLMAEALGAVVIGYADEVDSEASLGTLTMTVAGYTITADAVMARAFNVFGSPPIGISSIDNLAMNGVPIVVTGDANQTIGDAAAMVIINEQQTLSDGTFVVNALHAIVPGVADVAVGSAAAGATSQASAVVASY